MPADDFKPLRDYTVGELLDMGRIVVLTTANARGVIAVSPHSNETLPAKLGATFRNDGSLKTLQINLRDLPAPATGTEDDRDG